jgi:hypothetical protein
VGGIFEIVSMVLNLSSVTSVTRYGIYVPSQLFIRRATHISIIAWSDAIKNISHNVAINHFMRKYKICIHIIEIIMVIICISLGMITSMIQYTYGNVYSLNLSFLLFINFVSVYTLLASIITLISAKKLAILCTIKDNDGIITPSKDNNEMSNRMKVISHVAAFFVLFEFGLSLLPLWLLSPNGLNNISYYYFIVYKFPLFFGILILPWAVTKREDIFGLSLTHHSSNNNNNSNNNSNNGSGNVLARVHKSSPNMQSNCGDIPIH